MSGILIGPSCAAGEGQSAAQLALDAARLDLTALEYQCARGVNLPLDEAARLGAAARSAGITPSVHAPYFINLSFDDEIRIEKNAGYLLASAQLAEAMGARRIVVHCAGRGRRTREEAFANTLKNVPRLLAALDENGYRNISLCIETMGKVNVIGTLEEVIRICALDERLLPCLDFGHLYARSGGALKGRDAYHAVFDAVESGLGRARCAAAHLHFSRVEYSASGEERHVTLAERTFGPDFTDLAPVLLHRAPNAVLICESAGTQFADARTLSAMLSAARRRHE